MLMSIFRKENGNICCKVEDIIPSVDIKFLFDCLYKHLQEMVITV